MTFDYNRLSVQHQTLHILLTQWAYTWICDFYLVSDADASGSLLSDPTATLSDHLLVAVLSLLKREVSEHGRHLAQYFHLFLMYANLGVAEVKHFTVKLKHLFVF